MIDARRLMLAALLAGPLLGALAGVAVDSTMKPAPEPTWRQFEPDVIFTQEQPNLAFASPVDLDPPGSFDFRRPGFPERFAGFAPEPAGLAPPVTDYPVADYSIDAYPIDAYPVAEYPIDAEPLAEPALLPLDHDTGARARGSAVRDVVASAAAAEDAAIDTRRALADTPPDGTPAIALPEPDDAAAGFRGRLSASEAWRRSTPPPRAPAP